MTSLQHVVQEVANCQPYRTSSNLDPTDRRWRRIQRGAAMIILAAAICLGLVVWRLPTGGIPAASEPLAVTGWLALMAFSVASSAFVVIELFAPLLKFGDLRGYNMHHDSSAIAHDYKHALSLARHSLDDLKEASLWIATRAQQEDRRASFYFGDKAAALTTGIAVAGFLKVVIDATMPAGTRASPFLFFGAVLLVSIGTILVRRPSSLYAYQQQLLESAIRLNERSEGDSNEANDEAGDIAG